MKNLSKYTVESLNKTNYPELDNTLTKREKKKLQDFLYKELSNTSLTSKYYQDNDWSGVRKVTSTLADIIAEYSNKSGKEFEVSVYPDNGGYRMSKDCMSQWKQYIVDITLKGAEKPSLTGTLNRHAAGSTDDPFERYDITVCVNYW